MDTMGVWGRGPVLQRVKAERNTKCDKKEQPNLGQRGNLISFRSVRAEVAAAPAGAGCSAPSRPSRARVVSCARMQNSRNKISVMNSKE